MAVMADVSDGDNVILFHKQVGYVRGKAMQKMPAVAMGSSAFKVYVDSRRLPGIREMVVDVNEWDVYLALSRDVLELIRNEYFKGDSNFA